MKSLLKRHRVRATFYHCVSVVFVLSTILTEAGFIDMRTGFWIGAILFFVDYLAEMYDPNPEAPGPWFKRHFHRFFNDSDELEVTEIDVKEILTRCNSDGIKVFDK